MHQANKQLANCRSAAKPIEIKAEQNWDGSSVKTWRMRRNVAVRNLGSANRQIVDQEDADLFQAEARWRPPTAALAKARRFGLFNAANRSGIFDGRFAGRARSSRRSGVSTQRSVVSPVSAVVADVIARPGETLAAGAPVVSLLPANNIFGSFFADTRILALSCWRPRAVRLRPLPRRSRRDRLLRRATGRVHASFHLFGTDAQPNSSSSPRRARRRRRRRSSNPASR